MSCSGPGPSGADIATGEVGDRTFTVTATDGVGKSSTETATYYVVESPHIDVRPTGSPSAAPVVGVGTALTGTLTFTDLNGVGETVTWNWGDGSADTDAVHSYTTRGVHRDGNG